MKTAFQEPKFNQLSFTCPHCGVLAQMEFFIPSKIQQAINYNLSHFAITNSTQNFIAHIRACIKFYADYGNSFAVCQNCNEISIWVDEKMVYPKTRLTPLPNKDLPDGIKADYEEASRIIQDSPRGACALLRLALQKLMIYLGEDKNLDRAIKSLIDKKKIDEILRKALDSVRVIGNSAVHPNELDVKDNVEIATALFKIINYIAEKILSDKREIEEIYGLLPESAKRENRG